MRRFAPTFFIEPESAENRDGLPTKRRIADAALL
jgi:hypothetical protein